MLHAMPAAPGSECSAPAEDIALCIEKRQETMYSQKERFTEPSITLCDGNDPSLSLPYEQYESLLHVPSASAPSLEAPSPSVTLVDSSALFSNLLDSGELSGIYAIETVSSDDDITDVASSSPSVPAVPPWKEDDGQLQNMKIEGGTNFSELSGNVKLQDAFEDQRLTPPPSSSPAADASQTGILSSPARRPDNRDECHVIRSPENSPTLQDTHGDCDLSDTSVIVQATKRKRIEGRSGNEDDLGPAPNPKRLTNKLQQLQYEKLKLPFRSPLLVGQGDWKEGKTVSSLVVHRGAVRQGRNDEKGDQLGHNKEIGQKYRTTKAAAQFKSPLPVGTISKLGSMVRMTPNVQELERRLQVLKRALKIKQQNQGGILEVLTQKWIDACREVAWELWSLVKDNGTQESEWRCAEWSDKNDVRRNGLEDSGPDRWHDGSPGTETAHSRGEDDDSGHKYADAEGQMRNTFEMMLRQLGVDPKTLGWDEERGFEDQ